MSMPAILCLLGGGAFQDVGDPITQLPVALSFLLAN